MNLGGSDPSVLASGQAIGTFHAVSTRDAVGLARDGWPFFEINSMATNHQNESLFEIRFGDGEWMLAAYEDLQGSGGPN
ncbi:hypothetical protein AOC05_00335 [Arthrobacter alpinus]|uniref:Uncharacterized protein n=1 Tax=Arthrobacter alpinus TaxID=656366 RepID=A0A0M4RLP8_9MICC|nr:hypothetical protein AOC05_00335 [Arthrobacter alpinus]